MSRDKSQPIKIPCNLDFEACERVLGWMEETHMKLARSPQQAPLQELGFIRQVVMLCPANQEEAVQQLVMNGCPVPEGFDEEIQMAKDLIDDF